ncbi:hypothetical protein D3C75_1001690 [compost metagenome]|jgi:hypothetical protein
MSLPNIPNITPIITLTRQESITLLLSSIALEEIALSHILNAEGEKIQRLLQNEAVTLDDMLHINRSVERTLRNIIKNQMLLQMKLEDVLDLEHRTSRDDDEEDDDDDDPNCQKPEEPYDE